VARYIVEAKGGVLCNCFKGNKNSRDWNKDVKSFSELKRVFLVA